MLRKISLLSLLFIFSSLLFADDVKDIYVSNDGIVMDIPCPEGINLLPMYGGVEKCRSQIISDERYVAEMIENESDTLKSSMGVLDTGWMHLHQKKYDLAMRRFNQAWLIDSTNVMVYVSFVTLQDLKGELESAKQLLDETIRRTELLDGTKVLNTQALTKFAVYDFLISCIIFSSEKTGNTELLQYLLPKVRDFGVEEMQNNLLIMKVDHAISSIIVVD